MGGLLSTKRRFRSLASKFFLLTATLVFWVVFVILLYDLRQDMFDVAKGFLLCVIVLLVASAIAQITTRLLGRPLSLLHDGIRKVRLGRLEPIPVSRTADEIEFLGDSFNDMISALSATQAELRRANELLEERIRQRTAELEDAMRKALAANEAKTEFLANISHELRTPMNGVLGMMTIALNGDMTPEQRDNLETAQRCAYSLLAVLNDVLDWSKIEAGRMALERIPFDLLMVIDDSVKTHAIVAAEKLIALRADLAGDLPRVVEGDPLRLRQVLSNLLSNAVKFTPEGSVTLRARTLDAADAARVRVEISVEDTGIGIPDEKQQQIFEMFTQADTSISRRFGGTGLGLSITRRLVEMQGGALTLRSQPGRGSTFTVTLEYGRTETLPASAPAASGPRGAGEILVVEDNQVNQKLVAGILARHGYSAVLANTGVEALRELQAGHDRFRLVLMDVQMPEMDGLETTRRIRGDSRWRHLPVIAMTARAMDDDRELCRQAGMNTFLSKPIHAGHLMNVIQEFALPSERPEPETASAAV